MAGNIENVQAPSSNLPDRFDAAVQTIENEITEMSPEKSPHQSYARLCDLLASKYQHTNALGDLDRAIEYWEQGTAVAPLAHAEVSGSWSGRGILMFMRFEHSGDLNDLERAIQASQQAISEIHGGQPDRGGMLDTLSRRLYCKWENTGDPETLGQAIKAGEEAVAATSGEGDSEKAGRLDRLSRWFDIRFSILGELGDVQKAIAASEEAVQATTSDHPDLAARLNNLSIAFDRRFIILGDRDDLESSIRACKEAVVLSPVGHPLGPTLLSNLGNRLYSRFEVLGELEDLGKAIEANEQALATAPADHRDRPRMLDHKGCYLSGRFEHLGTLEDLENAIQAGQEAVAASPPEHPDRPGRLSNLSCSFSLRFGRFGDVGDLQKAIAATEEALEATPPGHPNRACMLDHLGGHLSCRFRRLGTVEDLENGIQACEGAVAATPVGHPDRLDRLDNLGTWLELRFWRLGDVGDLERAVTVSEEVLDSTPVGHPDRAARLHTLSIGLRYRFERLGVLQDLEAAIGRIEDCIAETPANHLGRASRLNTLACVFNSRFTRLGDVEDLERAIRAGEEGIEATPADHPNRAMMLTNQGAYLANRFKRVGDIGDLEKWIQVSEEAVEATPEGHFGRAVRLHTLSLAWNRKFSRWGAAKEGGRGGGGGRREAEDYLERAIQTNAEAVASLPAGHRERPVMLDHMGCFLSHRYNLLGALDDLEKAIWASREALAAASTDDPIRRSILSNMANRFGTRFCRLGVLDDLEKAIQANQEAVEFTPSDHPDRAGILHNLGRFLSRRFELVGEEGGGGVLSDIDGAISASRMELDALPQDHPDRASALSNLGCFLHGRYRRLGDLADLDAAIRATEEAVGRTPSDHPNRAEILLSLAEILDSASKSGQAVAGLSDPLDIFLQAWDCHLSIPRVRIGAARSAAGHLAAACRWKEASSLLEKAIQLLPKVTPQFLARGDLEHLLSDFSQLAADAMSIALQAGETPSHCLRLMELGRGIIMGFPIDCRSDLSDLQLHHPGIVETLNRLRTEIDSPSVDNLQTLNDSPYVQIPAQLGQPAGEDKRRRRVQAIYEMDQTLSSIRQLPGFERFHLPPSAEELIAMAAEGPIVIINTTTLRSDAIIVRSSRPITSLQLPRLVFSEAKERMARLPGLVRGSHPTYSSRNGELDRLLLWLWEAAVEPVFKKLRYRAVMEDELLPRVWWIGVGPLAGAPFHAAGDHSRRSTRNTLSRAISSYVSTIKALSYARQKSLDLHSPDSRLLLVTMPTTPETPATPSIAADPGSPAVPASPAIAATGIAPAVPRTAGTPAVYRTLAVPGIKAQRWKPLKNSTREVEDIMAVVKENSHHTATVRLDSPSVALVLAELPSFHAIHFACHGVSDRNPSNSHLLLLGDTPLQSGKLTVKAISAMNIKNAQMAYLSACCTAQNPSAQLADESIHIASGFQLAGFSHVLATLWQSDDDACRRVSGEFYRLLFAEGGSGMGHRAVSTAFHHAVKKLRKDILGQPIKWASFIHTGA